MKKIVSNFYYVFLIIGLALIFVSMFYNRVQTVDTASLSETKEVEPMDVKQINENTREFYFEPDLFDSYDSSLAFYTTHQNVEVYQNGEVIFSLQGEPSVFGSTPGFRWNFAQVDLYGSIVTVRMEAVYDQVREAEITFYRGDALKLYMEIMRSSMLEVIISVLNLIIGIVMLIYWAMVSRRLPIGRSLYYLGIFATMMGMWSLNEAELMTFFMSNRTAASFTGFALIMLMIAPFTMFVREFLGIKKEKISNVICVLSYLNFAVSLGLHMSGIKEFKETVFTTHFLMLVALMYLIYALYVRYHRFGLDRVQRVNVIGMFILAFSYFGDIFSYYIDARKTDMIGRLGFLIYIGLLAWQAAVDSLEKINEGRKVAIYKELAEKDLLTKVYNRNAYDEWAMEYPTPKNTALITFDLNNLKACNDSLGHSEGDRYIQTSAEYISQVFGTENNCYRIGGDEFCVVITNAKEDWIKQKIAELEQMQKQFNLDGNAFTMEIAHGYAIFDERKDRNIEETRKRADAEMYENKKAIKDSNSNQMVGTPSFKVEKLLWR